MPFYAAAALINFGSSLLFGLLVFIRNPRNKINYSYSLFAFGVAFWSFCYFFWQISETAAEALFWSKALMAFAIFIPAFYSHFVFVFTGLTKRKILLLILAYLLLGSFLPLDIFGSLFIQEVKPLLGFKFWPIAGPAFHIFLTIWMGYVIYDTYLLYKSHKKATGIYKNQIKYVFWGLTLAFLGGVSNYFLWYEILIPPFANILVTAYVTLTAIAIVRHRLMDIRLVLARTIAYSVIVGFIAVIYVGTTFLASSIFFGLEVDQKQLLIYLTLTFILAISFSRLRRLLETITDKIFYKKYYDPQELLKDLSTIMSTTLELETLTLSILDKVTQNIRVAKSVFVLLSKDEKSIDYIENKGYESKPSFERNVLDLFMDNKRITIFDDLDEGEIKETMRKLNVSIALRLSIRNQKIGVLFLGEKASGDLYSDQDINVLEILAPQLSIAIQNSREYEEIKRFNITLGEEVQKATKELKIANEKLQELDKLKDEFVSIASHELRTPMTVIKSYIWLLLNDKEEKLSEKQAKHLNITYDSVERLIKLVNDMLDVSRIESGRIVLTPAPTDIEKLAQDVIAEMNPKAQEEQIDLSLEKDPDPLPQVFVDPDKTKEVLINLIGNSLKFTPNSGKIKIRLSKKDGMIEASISDTGEGMKAEDIPKLFQKFGIVANNYPTKQDVQGTGLGLYISKSIIELQGGKMWAESEGENKGSTFSFTLKIADGNTVQAAPQPVATVIPATS